MVTAPLTALCDATIFTGETMVENHVLLIKNGMILDIVAQGHIPADAQRVSYRDCILTAGFIDAQVNGGGGVLFNNSPTPEACMAIAKAHQRRGTTRLLPTVITDRLEITVQALNSMREARKTCPNILGIHLEGPHLSLERCRAHNEDYLRPCTDKDLLLYQRKGDEVFLITVAPEIVSPEQIKALHQQGVIISLGHTNGLPDQVRAGLEAGATGFTHLFNAMSGLNAREPGVAGTALDDRESWCGLIADGFHVSPEMIRLAWRAKPQGKLFLVSDAASPAGSDKPEAFELYGKSIRVEKGQCINDKGSLAGSSITLSDAVRHIVKIGIDLEEALRMGSAYPAAFLRLDKKLGRLLPDYAADVVVLDEGLGVRDVWVAGNRAV